MSCHPPAIFDKTSRWFDRARAALLNQLPCRAGCCRCCIGPFPITTLDAQELRRGLPLLEPGQRRAIEDRAVRQTETMEAAYPRLRRTPSLDEWEDREIDRLVRDFADIPCPALEADGRCGLYEHRPLACRSMGIPTDDQGLVQGACEVQTFVPVIRLSAALRKEEEWLACEEEETLDRAGRKAGMSDEELLLPYGFLPQS